MSGRLHHSIIFNWTGLAVRIGVSLVLLPYVVNTIGVASYGEYVFLVAIFGYSGVLEIGLRASILRYTGALAARREFGQLNRILGSIFVYYTAIAALVLLAGLVLWLAPPEFILPVGASPRFPFFAGIASIVAATTFFRIGWSSVVRARERYDLLNAIEVTGVILRAAVIVFLLRADFGLLGVLVGDLVDNLFNATASRIAVRRIEPGIRLDFRRLEREQLRDVLGYSGWAFLNAIAFQFRFRGPNIIVGGVLSTAIAGFYGVATRLQSYVWQLGTAMNSPFRARATSVAGAQGDAAVRPILYQGTRYLTFLGGSVCLLLYAHAHQLLLTWMGPDFQPTATILRILLLGLTAEISALMLGGALFATGHLKTMSISNLVEAAVMITAAYFMARPFGANGVAIAVSGAVILNKVVAQPLLLLSILGVPLGDWLTRVLWRPVVAVGSGAVLVWALRAVWLPDSLLEVAAQLLLGGAALLGLGWLLVVEPGERDRLFRPTAGRDERGEP